MAKNWWNWLGKKSLPRRSPRLRSMLERLEDRTTPTITLSGVSITGPINEGGSATLTGSYTATNVIGALTLNISASAPISFTSPVLLPGSGTFSVPITFLDNNTPPTSPVTLDVSLTDSGPAQITSSADAGGYRAFGVPFITNTNLNDSLAAQGANSGIQTLLLPSGTTNNQNGQISLGTNTFRYYGVSVGNQLAVNENGLVTFNGLAPTTADNNGNLSTLPNTIGALAALWTDLALSPSGRVSFRFADLDGNTANGQEYLIIEWANALHVVNGGTGPSLGTFQVFLQLNTGTANGDIIYNYIDTDFGVASVNFGASATVGIKNLNPAANNLTQLAVNPGPNASIINNFSNQHAVRFSSNAITLPLGFGTTDAGGYKPFRMPFESRVDLAPGTSNGQATNVILTGTFSTTPPPAVGFQSGPQPLQSTINVGTTPVISNNTFNFYGTTYNNLSVSKNGYIAVSGAAADGTQLNPTSLSTNPATATIAALWDEWNGLAGAGAQVLGRFVDFDGNGTPEYLVINWKGVNNGGINPTTPQNFATFQTILQLNTGTDSGGIYLNYQDTDVGNAGFNNGASATVGIKDITPTNGRFTNVSVNNSNADLASSRAIGLFQIGSASQSTTIQVNNVAPTVSGNPNDNLTINEGGTFTRPILINDPGIRDTFTGTIDFGDGTPVQPITVAAGMTTTPLNHVYGDSGTYTVTINLTDNAGGMAMVFTYQVTVNNVAPVLDVTDSVLIRPGQMLVLDGSSPTNPLLGTFTDTGFSQGTSMETFTTTIDWGDGVVVVFPPNSADNTQTVTNGGPGVLTMGTIAARHTYTGRGTFTVTVTVTDDDGGSTTQTFLVGVGSENLYAVAGDAGGPPLVRVFDSRLNVQSAQFNAYNTAFRGGVRVGIGDVSGDLLPDVVTSPGFGGGPHIKVFEGGTFNVIRQFNAYSPLFTGGVFVAVGDVNGDGRADIVTGAGFGGGPHVRAFSGLDNSILFDMMVYDIAFTGGVRVAVGDLNNDGFGDIITAPGEFGGPHVKAFSGQNSAKIADFFAYDPSFRGGVFVTSADLNNDGADDIITGPGNGGGPHVKIFDNFRGGVLIAEFNAFPPGSVGPTPVVGDSLWTEGVRVGVTDVNGDDVLEILAGPGTDEQSFVRIIDGTTFAVLEEFQAFDDDFLGGVFVAGN